MSNKPAKYVVLINKYCKLFEFMFKICQNVISTSAFVMCL